MAQTGEDAEQVSGVAEAPAQVAGSQGPDPQGPAAEDVLLEEGSSLEVMRSSHPQKSTNYFLTEGILYRQGKNQNQKFLFTELEKLKAFWEAHVVEDRHYGSRNTCANLRKKYYWPGVSIDTQKWIKKCKKCQDRRIRMAAQAALEARDPQEESKASPRFSAPQDKGLFSFACLQLFGPLQQTPRGACFAFVTIDYFTKSVHAAPLPACSPEETSKPVLELVRRFGLPEGIFSALRPGFILQLNSILKIALKIQHNVVVEYNPQTDGFLEESKAFVKRLLSLVLTANPTDWDQHLNEIFFLKNRPSGSEEEEEEEDLSRLEVELQEASSAPGENRPPSLCAPEAPKGSPASQRDAPVKGCRRKYTCLYCNRLPAEGDSDVFAVLQCDRCQVWAHDLCVRRQHGQAYQKTSIRCQSCLLTDEGARQGPGPSPFSGVLEAEEGRASSWGPQGPPRNQHGRPGLAPSLPVMGQSLCPRTGHRRRNETVLPEMASPTLDH